MDDYISRQALYERAATLEAQALDYVGKLIERDGDVPSTEWRIWSAILTERTAFKHDVYDASSTDVVEVVRCKECKHSYESVAGLICSHGVCVDCVVRDDFYCSYGERRDDY